MALQGTIDTFALPDVLRLLAATRKTGRLRLTGPRGSGATWVEQGAIVDIEVAHAPNAGELADALFELLRFEEGSFTFDVDLVCEDPRPSAIVEDLLGAAEIQLAEWREIEAVVPSLDAQVYLRRALPGPEVVIDRDSWATLVAIGGGTTVRQVAEELGLSELPVSRAVKDLVELGVADVDLDVLERAPDPAPAALHEPVIDHRPGPEPFGLDDAPRGFDDAPARFAGEQPAAEPLTPIEQLAVEDGASDDDLAQQLANLSPRAAEAVRAAAAATDEGERQAALDRAELAAAEDDDSVNRGLLLKFLSSVKT